MKATEFRLGNLISSGDDIFPVTLQEFRAFTFPDIINEYKPIPLTEEWLLKFGFKIFDSIRFLGDEYNIWKQLFSARFGLYTINKKEWICRILNQELIEIKYVHQLQNLYFALTGEELTIK